MNPIEIQTEQFECSRLKRTVTITYRWRIQKSGGVVVDRALMNRSCSGHGTCGAMLGQTDCAHPMKADPQP